MIFGIIIHVIVCIMVSIDLAEDLTLLVVDLGKLFGDELDDARHVLHTALEEVKQHGLLGDPIKVEHDVILLDNVLHEHVREVHVKLLEILQTRVVGCHCAHSKQPKQHVIALVDVLRKLVINQSDAHLKQHVRSGAISQQVLEHVNDSFICVRFLLVSDDAEYIE